ncbi:MAG: hypothetical protein Alpg2KO_04450 [Alphaproteobacteria bacterium]
MTADLVYPGLFVLGSLIAMLSCLKGSARYVIPNYNFLILLAGFAGAALIFNFMPGNINWITQIWIHVANMGIGFLIGIVFFALGMMGAGAVKLSAGFMLWMPSLLAGTIFMFALLVASALKGKYFDPLVADKNNPEVGQDISVGPLACLLGIGVNGWLYKDQLMTLMSSLS